MKWRLDVKINLMLTPLKVKASGILKQQIQLQLGHSNTSWPWGREEDRMVRWQDLSILANWAGWVVEIGWKWWIRRIACADATYSFDVCGLREIEMVVWTFENIWFWHCPTCIHTIIKSIKLCFHRFSDLLNWKINSLVSTLCAPYQKFSHRRLQPKIVSNNLNLMI